MKSFVNIVKGTVLATAALFLGFVGCEYDVTEPLWEQPFVDPPVPVITGVEPLAAPAGVNTIRITGENFLSVPLINGVYFDNTSTEVIRSTSTEIIVRRPSLITDSANIKVVPESTLVVAHYEFGSIDPVMERYGTFLEDIPLATVVVDDDENLYVAATDILWIVESDPDGGTVELDLTGTLRTSVDARLRDGLLYLTAVNNRQIQRVDLETGEISVWVVMPPGRAVRFGDFDADGYFYGGGGSGASGTDLCIIPPDPPSTGAELADLLTFAGAYMTEEIVAVRVYDGSVYVASREVLSPAKVWRHQITGPGQLGTRQLVVDLGEWSEFADREVSTMMFSDDGKLFIITDGSNPVLIYEPNTQTLDYFYKNIVPPNGRHAHWGNGNYLYMITNDAQNPDLALRWNIARIDIGSAGAPYH